MSPTRWLSWLLVVSGVGCAHAPALARCPEPARGETVLDCPWAGLARTAAAVSVERLPQLLDERAPSVWKGLARDALHPALATLWAQSRNFDENAHQTIVSPELLSLLGRRARLDGDGDVVHAGVTHTYGYLFSTLRTPFGYKRARWVDGEIEIGLHLAGGLLGPTPAHGTLLANVTCVLARLAMSPVPRAACADAAAALVEAALPRSHPRLEESVETERGAIMLATDWIAYSAERGLFVYSVTDSEGPQLITAFSASTTAWSALIAPERLGEGQVIETRWNAVVPGLSDAKAPLSGARRVLEVATAP